MGVLLKKKFLFFTFSKNGIVEGEVNGVYRIMVTTFGRVCHKKLKKYKKDKYSIYMFLPSVQKWQEISKEI
jgi:hypothetical protein